MERGEVFDKVEDEGSENAQKPPPIRNSPDGHELVDGGVGAVIHVQLPLGSRVWPREQESVVIVG